MNYDFNELNNNYKRKIESMGLLECYSTDNLNEILSKIELSLSYSNIPFRPAFKKVYKKGVNIQSAKNNNLINYNNGFYKEFSNVQATLENQKKLKKKNIAYKNLLQLIYNNSFFNYLNKEEGEELLKESIIKVINSNLDINYQKESKNKKVEKEDIKEYKYSKFNDLIKDDFRSEEFFKKVQRLIMIDEDDKNNKNNKNDKSKKSKKSDKNKYSGLMQDIFVYSFNEYLNKYYTLNQNKKINIMPEEISSYDINKLNVNVKTKIEKQEKLIQSYIYFKLLNNDILSELKNNLIKIQIYEKDKVNRTELDEKIKLIDNYIELINIVILTNSMNDFSNEKGIEDELRKNYIKILKGFVEEKFFSNKCINKNNGENCAISTCDIDCNKKVYFTENGIKSLKNLIKLNKKGISSAYSEMYKNKKVTMTDIENFKNCQKNIVENQNKAEELHKKLVKYKNRKGNEEKYNELYEEYKSVLSNVKEYNKYKAIVMLNDISNINKLNIEIISRLNGFWTDLERDVQFIRKYAYCIEEFDNHDNGIWLNNYEDVRDYSKKNKKKFIQGKINNIEKQICGFEYKGVTKNIRNHIAHFEQYRNPKYSLMELINHTFEEMKYDSKRRNAVTKSIIDLCERHGLLIDFKLDSGEYSINFIKSKEINYLGKKTNYGNTPIKQPLYDERYLEMVKVLFEYKNK